MSIVPLSIVETALCAILAPTLFNFHLSAGIGTQTNYIRNSEGFRGLWRGTSCHIFVGMYHVVSIRKELLR